MSELSTLDATAQAELVRTGAATPLELVDAAIARIERHDAELNAVIVRLFESARATATSPLRADAPFRGVPILVKDLLATVGGAPYAGGLRLLKDAGFRSPHDSYLVRRLREAGFVITGKTSCSELGIVPTTEPVAWGPSRNPWNAGHSTGGSSGGSAAAVAAGLVPIAHANDGGGSIRIPASCCGLVGLKPSRGRASLGPDHGDVMGGLVNEGVVARSVRDAAALLDVVAGAEPGDPYAAPPPARPFAAEVGAPVEPLRVGFAKRYMTPTGQLTTIHPACLAAVHATAKLLADLGHSVEEVELPALHKPEYVARFLAVWSAGVAADLDALEPLVRRKLTADDVEPLTWALYQMGRAVTAPAYLAAWTWLQRTAREIAAAWTTTMDVWLTTTITQPPPPLGFYDSSPQNPLEGIFKAAGIVPFTAPFNVTGQPAISLPLHVAEGNLPVGVQLVGAYGREDLLLRLAAQLEAARPFAHRATRA
jgi:amidase